MAGAVERVGRQRQVPTLFIDAGPPTGSVCTCQ
jgi:hypothetical protein